MKKWYYNSWFLGVLYLVGGIGSLFIVGFPLLIAAVILTVSKNKNEKVVDPVEYSKYQEYIKLNNDLASLSTELDSSQSKYDEIVQRAKDEAMLKANEISEKKEKELKASVAEKETLIHSLEDKITNKEHIFEKYFNEKKASAELKINEILLKKERKVEELDHQIENKEQMIQEHIKEATEKVNTTIETLNTKKESIENRVNKLIQEEKELNSQIIQLNDEILYQSFGLYTPIYDFANAEAYKDRIAVIRQNQKNLISNNQAVSFPKDWAVNGNKAKGTKMIKDNVKQILRAFNTECEAVIGNAKFNNIESIRQRIIKSYESLNKLNSVMNIGINDSYLQSKLEELNLSYEYALKKQQEKEDAKEERDRLREDAKVQKEIEESRKNISKEQTHYQNALQNIKDQIAATPENERSDLIEKEEEILAKLIDVDLAMKDVNYREANKRAGYVYIISNIGAFGENIYKIGMTRRSIPMDRVNELGDASVPFNFDVHAMIFSDDAPSLENALHKAFEDKKVNMINQRREFFNVTIEEIQTVVKNNYDKTVDFVKIPEAEHYRESLMLRESLAV